MSVNTIPTPAIGHVEAVEYQDLFVGQFEPYIQTSKGPFERTDDTASKIVVGTCELPDELTAALSETIVEGLHHIADHSWEREDLAKFYIAAGALSFGWRSSNIEGQGTIRTRIELPDTTLRQVARAAILPIHCAAIAWDAWPRDADEPPHNVRQVVELIESRLVTIRREAQQSPNAFGPETDAAALTTRIARTIWRSLPGQHSYRKEPLLTRYRP